MKTRLDTYLNVLADVFGIGPLKLLYDKSLKDKSAEWVQTRLWFTLARTQTFTNWLKEKHVVANWSVCFTYMYWRLPRQPKEFGIVPCNLLLDRTSVLSFANLPISVGIGPIMLLFCSRLGQKKHLPIKKLKKITLDTKTCSIHGNNTHSVSSFVRFPMLGESRPERSLLGASLSNMQTYENYMVALIWS
jgi:hypothetical protein